MNANLFSYGQNLLAYEGRLNDLFRQINHAPNESVAKQLHEQFRELAGRRDAYLRNVRRNVSPDFYKKLLKHYW